MTVTRHCTQMFTPFGGYVPEQHPDEALSKLVPPDVDQVVNSLTAAMFDEVMKSLRSALGHH